MGHFSMTCSVSGLPIMGGDAVRCLLLVATPWSGWLPRTPPIRAKYDNYGSIEDVHPDDAPIVALWLRGLREDVVEKGLGDNSIHDVPVRRDMTLEGLLDAARGRLEVRQDAMRFWMRPLEDDDQPRYSALCQRVERILEEHWPGSVSRGAEKDKFHVDEPVPCLARVRWGSYQSGEERLGMLEAAKGAIEGVRRECDGPEPEDDESVGLVAMVTAGTGRYPDDANLLVHAAPAADGERVTGAQWDTGPGRDVDDNKTMRVCLAMIREDVWQALIAFPHGRYVSLPCENCGQPPAYHKDTVCPMESINGMPYKEHPEGSTYAHGPVFPPEVPHFIEKRWSEYAWHGLEAFKETTRSTWARVSARMARWRDGLPAEPDSGEDSGLSDEFMRTLERIRKEDEERLAAMSPEERAVEEAKRAEARARWEAEEQRKRENPFFGDFLIRDMDVEDADRPGAWVFRDSEPGVIGISEHLSMLIADRVEAPPVLLDAIAELSAVQWAIRGVGVVIRPAASTGPQDPEWQETARYARVLLGIAAAKVAEGQEGWQVHARHARVLLGIAEARVAERQEDGLEGTPAFMTYAEAEAALCGKTAQPPKARKKAPAKRKPAKKAKPKAKPRRR